MPKIILWEECNAVAANGDPTPSLANKIRTEGGALICAVANDFAAVARFTVELAWSAQSELPLGLCERVRLRAINLRDSIDDFLSQAAKDCDAVGILAPETDGLLEHRSRIIEEAGGRLLGPDSAWVRLAADKHQLCEFLRAADVPVPIGGIVPKSEEQFLEQLYQSQAVWPAIVVKPRAGAGGWGVRILTGEREMRDWHRETATGKMLDAWRWERYVPGMPASIAAIGMGSSATGQKHYQLCPPGEQMLIYGSRKDISYVGGRIPLGDELARRMCELARRALDCLPPFRGYVGLDLVLANSAAGFEDVVIEINPRWTTSYVGLRKLARTNLAEYQYAAVRGQPLPPLEFNPGKIEFDTNGNARIMNDR
ncbi:MAG: ATP-grasp domain-containing protein [Pirellulales bacterium]|nr:ATP-grasp domain-containing protein [Pirellulales bacterium]